MCICVWLRVCMWVWFLLLQRSYIIGFTKFVIWPVLCKRTEKEASVGLAMIYDVNFSKSCCTKSILSFDLELAYSI